MKGCLKNFCCKKNIFITIGIMIFNTLLYPVLLLKELSFADRLKLVIEVNFVYLIIIGFLIGIVLSFVPYKTLKYGQRVVTFSFMFLFIFSCIECLGLVFIAFMKWGMKCPFL